MTSASPTSFEEFHGHTDGVAPQSRFYNKLAPEPVHDGDHQYYSNSPSNSRRQSESKPAITSSFSASSTSQSQRRRGRQSKDEQLALENSLPASAEDLAAMTHQEIQRLMRDPKLSSAQKALIKKIRRRGNSCAFSISSCPLAINTNGLTLGRNKVAARKCRERRVNDRSAPVVHSVQAQFYDDYFEEKVAVKQVTLSPRKGMS